MIIEVSILASIFITVVQIIAESALKHRGNNIEVCSQEKITRLI